MNSGTLDLFGDNVEADKAGVNTPPEEAAPATEPVANVVPSHDLPASQPPANEPPVNEPPANEPPSGEDDQFHLLKDFSKNAYIQYGVSVVKGRAIPAITDGQKPVQRRILYAMQELGLTANSSFKKSARIVGDVIGKYHPHGDTAAYDALVRMAQGFTLRYPIIDGQGNFGSRDGDMPAAMRYTESRLSKYAELLLSEINAGTVDFKPNYDGSENEPADLPARMPFLLLNGASGIAVGMATECLPHNMREVAAAAVAILKGKIGKSGDAAAIATDLMHYIKGPDFPGGGQIVSSVDEIRAVYETGRGSLRVRARWEIEQQARGQWRMIVNELPYGISVRHIMEKLGDISDPQIKTGKKELSNEQKLLRQLTMDYIETIRDESGKDAAVRIVIEPRTSRIDQQQFIAFLLKHTSLEENISVNMTTIGLDGKPDQKNLYQLLSEWTQYRTITVTRRTRTRLEQVQKRLHILEGRMIAFLNIDKVIKVIREADDPEADLIKTFNLSEIQAKDILEIRLRQLARLEGIKIENEMKDLKEEEDGLKHLLANSDAMRDLIVSEIQADAKKFGDERRTLILEADRMTAKAATIPDEPCTIILSKNGWIKQRTGHDIDMATLTFKDGDSLLGLQKTRSVHPVILLDNKGRAYTLASTDIPGGRSDGVPVASLLDMQPKAKVVAMIAANPAARYFFSTDAGYGFIATIKNLVSRQKAGKAFMNIEDKTSILLPIEVADSSLIAAIASSGKLLAFPVEEMKEMSGGKGLIVQGMADNETMLSVATIKADTALKLTGSGRGGKAQELIIKWDSLQSYVSRRARKGVLAPVKFKVEQLTNV